MHIVNIYTKKLILKFIELGIFEITIKKSIILVTFMISRGYLDLLKFIIYNYFFFNIIYNIRKGLNERFHSFQILLTIFSIIRLHIIGYIYLLIFFLKL